MTKKKGATVIVEASIPAEMAGPVAVEASKRNISIGDLIGAAALAAIYGLAHPFVAGKLGNRREEPGSEREL